MPVFTVIIAHFIFNEKLPCRVYISLVPVIVGVLIATVTELQFDMFGLISAIVSTFIFSFLNVFVKKVFQDTGMHPINLLLLNSQLASFILFPIWLLTDALKIWNNHAYHTEEHTLNQEFILYLLLAGLCSFFQNLCAFLLIHQLTTLSYSIANTTKRIFVIFLSLATLKNPVTPLNVCGMIISILGIFIYNMSKNAARTDKSFPEIGAIFERRDRSNSIFDVRTLRTTGSEARLLLTTN